MIYDKFEAGRGLQLLPDGVANPVSLSVNSGLYRVRS